MARRQINFHDDLSRNHAQARSSDRSVGVVFVLIALVAGGALLWNQAYLAGAGVLALGVVLIALTVAAPHRLRPLARAWLGLGMVMHSIVSPVVMGIIFFLVVTPTGLIMRLLGKRPLQLKFEPELSSYWLKREPPGPDPETMKHQF